MESTDHYGNKTLRVPIALKSKFSPPSNLQKKKKPYSETRSSGLSSLSGPASLQSPATALSRNLHDPSRHWPMAEFTPICISAPLQPILTGNSSSFCKSSSSVNPCFHIFKWPLNVCTKSRLLNSAFGAFINHPQAIFLASLHQPHPHLPSNHHPQLHPTRP